MVVIGEPKLSKGGKMAALSESRSFVCLGDAPFCGCPSPETRDWRALTSRQERLRPRAFEFEGWAGKDGESGKS